jgi:hypothetical protein
MLGGARALAGYPSASSHPEASDGTCSCHYLTGAKNELRKTRRISAYGLARESRAYGWGGGVDDRRSKQTFCANAM